MYIRNFSTQFKYELYGFQAQLTFRVGFAMTIFDLFGESLRAQSLLLAIDAVHPRDYTKRIDIGAEYLFHGRFTLCGG